MMRRLRHSIGALWHGLIVLALLTAGSVQGAGTAPPLAPADERATRIVLEKAERRLSLLRGDRVIRTYRVALGGDPIGPKQRQGDSRTPEGRYEIDRKNSASRFHLSLGISYPDANDRARARAAGVSPGGDIMIHGLPNGHGAIGAAHSAYDWTDGCAAVTDAEIEEIWSLVEIGTPIEIKP